MSEPDSNTLDIRHLQAHRAKGSSTNPDAAHVGPVAEPTPAQPMVEHVAHNPAAAAAARERLAAIPDPNPLRHPDAVPAAPTASLVTDKATLAHRTDLAPTTSRRKLPSAFAPLLTAAGIFLLVLLLFKAPIIFSQISYTLNQSSGQSTGTGTTTSATSVIPSDNTISIPKINVHAPVEYIDSVQETDVQRALQDGVVHYGTTALPGTNGNVAIFGHSSNDWWEPGNFKFVFVLLDKLAPGDQVIIDYQSVRYTYEVTGSKIVEPTAVDVLNATTTPTLTLITCSPPGTSLKRLVVTAKQVSPAPKGSSVAVTTGTNTTQNTLPSSAPGFFDQVGNFFGGVWQGITSLFGGSSSSTSQPSSSPGASGGTLPVIK